MLPRSGHFAAPSPDSPRICVLIEFMELCGDLVTVELEGGGICASLQGGKLIDGVWNFLIGGGNGAEDEFLIGGRETMGRSKTEPIRKFVLKIHMIEIQLTSQKQPQPSRGVGGPKIGAPRGIRFS